MFPKILSAISGSASPAQQAAVSLPEDHRTCLRFNESRTPIFLSTRFSPALVRDYYGGARGANGEMIKDFTNMPRPVTAAAMQLVMDLLGALKDTHEAVSTTQPKQETTTVQETTTGTIFAPSTPPFVPLQSRELYAASSTPRLIDAAFLASRLELEAPFEGLAAEIGRRVHKLVTFGGVPWVRTAKHYVGKDFPPDESVLHAVCRPEVAVNSTAELLAEIAAGLRNEMGLSDRTSGPAAAERFSDLAVLFNIRDANAVSCRHDDKAALRRLLRRRWQPDEEAQQCKACKVTFRLVAGVLRSHCRRCGDVYCKSCVEAYTTSKAFATLEKPDAPDSGDAPRKICRTCHEVVGEGTVARFYMELIEGMGLSIPDVRALMLLDDTWEAATVEVLWQYRNHMYMMRPSVAHNAIVLSTVGVAANHPEFLLRVLEVEALWLLPERHPTVMQMLAAAASTFGRDRSMFAGCGQLYCTRACDNARKDIGTFAVRVLRAIAHRDVNHAMEVRTMALRAIHAVLNIGTDRNGASLNADAWLHALLDMYFSATTCSSARGRDIVPVTESELTANRDKLGTRLRTLLDAIAYIAVRSDRMRMKVVCEIAYRQSTKDTAVKGWCAILEKSMSVARSNYEIVCRVRAKNPATATCFSDIQGIGTFQTVLSTLVQCAQDAAFQTEHEVRDKLFRSFPHEYKGKTANDTIWFPGPAPYFFNPRKFMHGIVLREVNLHSSNTRPADIVFLVSDTPASPDRDEGKCERACVILKRDRLRQDQICCEVAALLPQLMQADTPPHKILSYHVLPLTEECGIVERLDNAPNLQKLTKDEGKTLAEFLSTQITGRDDTRCTFFLNSVRYLIMLSLVLGLGDRHRSNMVLDRNQLQLCHIDFGRVLGDRTVFEKADRLLNFCRTGTWDPKDIVVRFDDELAAAVQAMGGDPEQFINSTVRLVVQHVRPNVELLYMVMSRLLEEPRQQQRSNLLPTKLGQGPELHQQRTALYPADSPYIGLLSYQRATAPLYDRMGRLIDQTEDAHEPEKRRALRERSPGYTDPVYQYLHQCLRTSQKDQAVIRELSGLLRARNRPIQDGSHWVNQAALSEGGWLNYGWGHVSAASTAAASSASEVATSWFGTVTDKATVLFAAAAAAAPVSQ